MEIDQGFIQTPPSSVTDTVAARYTRDRDGNLAVYNAKGQYLDTIPLKEAEAFISRFNQGQRDLAVDYSPAGLAKAARAKAGTKDGPAWANVDLRGAELGLKNRELEVDSKQFGQDLAERQRQYNETFGANKAQFNITQQFAEAKQRWQEAVDSRDFEAAEYWKARAQELNQNQLRMDYTKLLAGLTGPQDWIKYGRLSRQESPLGTPDGQTVPLDQAIPAWARGFNPGTYPDSRGRAPGAFGDTPAAPSQPAPAAPAAPAVPANVFQPKEMPVSVPQAGAKIGYNQTVQPPVGSFVSGPDGTKVFGTPGATSATFQPSDYFEKGGRPAVPAPRKPSAITDFSFASGAKPAWFEAAMAGKPTGDIR